MAERVPPKPAVPAVTALRRALMAGGAGTLLARMRTVRATMPAGSRLVIVELLQERNRPHPFASLSDIQMVTQCDGGRERSAAELQGLLSQAGLRPGGVYETAAPAMVEGFA